MNNLIEKNAPKPVSIKEIDWINNHLRQTESTSPGEDHWWILPNI